ncbi:methylated-DNA--[protein]-cysteine S-methyltransferase [Flagellimonas aequoris]|uniref:methylated-DNA--[protein]-cysteine S-methyltransferase n=1 Tax=Flagellimonas aequoris TaxID=2306997 RepID=A0A418N328_9FLAO|nr:methylated-DNA--[protein]-cysteine S-methyltransferase [Allomuricauda aequoris]RIV68287.1 methylated-DNA--[protein]-cysteine S-methyltransferase [Allomuricauda aequoris]TXJ99976.1 methylated-DNA--[protein]-cysteine S-methyltransferase [Allomuricauda aequoris]
MTSQAEFNYNRIAKAIAFIQEHFQEQPSLGEIAETIHVSPYHFQRLFTEWAGVSPKKFMQYISVEHAKQLLKQKGATLADAAWETGFSGTGRLHDLFVGIEGMTPGEFKNGGENLHINYSFAESPFGKMIVASTEKGICHMSFMEDAQLAFNELKSRFPNAHYQQLLDKHQQDGLFIFQHDWSKLDQIKLHLNGTPFQLKVWETLLKIPMGSLATYGDIAQKIEKPNASRAVGTALGNNPVAFLIPCHRVIQSTGKIGGYMWGNTRKTAIIGWEAAQTETHPEA